jgi:hypothetical protein
MHDQSTPARTRLLAVLLVPLGLLGGGVVAASAVGHTANPIVMVEGDAANGFGIQRLDGSWTFPPTDSEARAECGEYDRRIQRVRCRVQVRVWYRDLAAMKRTIAYYRAQAE